MKKNKIVLPFLAMLMLVLGGCGGTATLENFTREDVDYSFIQQIAVLPFTNATKNDTVPEMARDITITQVLALGLFDVVDKGIVNSVLADEAISTNVPIDPLSLKRVGQRLRAQAFLLGTVDHVEEGRIGGISYPEIGLTLRLVDANTGMILWHASGKRTGESWGRRLFGTKADDPFDITLKLIRDLLYTAPANS